MQTLASALVLWGLFGMLGLFALSRARRRPSLQQLDCSVIFVIPALNEAKVIGATIRHLLATGAEHVVVVDDASDDETAAVATAANDARVHLVKRELPEARKGKGAALNYALKWIDAQGFAGDPHRCIVGIVDADGRLKPGVLREVRAAFADPRVGGAQVSVRIRNRDETVWTRMQHFEFVSFTALYQRGRERTGGVGMGGNGQFSRLAALRALGADPWTDCLTEDQDLGIRLLLAGWKNRYLPTSWVSQQAVPDFKRLLRQRTRWFQGSLQCARHVPRIMAADLPLATRVDLVVGLVAPLLMLCASPIVAAGWLWFYHVVVAVIAGHTSIATLGYAYALTATPAVVLGYAYWLDEPSATLPGAILLGHAFVGYAFVWLLAGWRATIRQICGRNGWAKTARVTEPPAAVRLEGRVAA